MRKEAEGEASHYKTTEPDVKKMKRHRGEGGNDPLAEPDIFNRAYPLWDRKKCRTHDTAVRCITGSHESSLDLLVAGLAEWLPAFPGFDMLFHSVYIHIERGRC